MTDSTFKPEGRSTYVKFKGGGGEIQYQYTFEAKKRSMIGTRFEWNGTPGWTIVFSVARCNMHVYPPVASETQWFPI